MKDFVQASKKNKFSLSWSYPCVTCRRSSDALAARKSSASSLSRICWLSSLSPTLPHHFICDCKEKWSLGLFGHVGLVSYV